MNARIFSKTFCFAHHQNRNIVSAAANIGTFNLFKKAKKEICPNKIAQDIALLHDKVALTASQQFNKSTINHQRKHILGAVHI